MIYSAYSPASAFGRVESEIIAFTGGNIFSVFFLVNFIRSRKQFYILIHYFIIFTTLSAAIGIIQVIIYLTTGKLWYVYHEMEGKIPVIDYFGLGDLPRVSAFLSGAHHLGLMLLNVGCVLFLFLLTPGSHEKKYRKYYIISFILCCTALFFTHTRQNWISFLVALFFAYVIKKPNLRKPLLIIFIILTIVVFYFNIPQYMVNKFIESTPGSIHFRITAMQEAMDMTLKYPVTGIGFKQFREGTHLEHVPHNLVLLLTSETGLPGLIAFMIMFGFVSFRLLYYAAKCKNVKDQAILYAFFLIMLMTFLNGISAPTIVTKSLWFFIGLAEAAICQAAMRKAEERNLRPEFGFAN
jgi:O-antigen ligase